MTLPARSWSVAAAFRASVLPVTLVAVFAGSADQAKAGEFTVNTCVADRGRYDATAFDEFATRGMRVRRACNPQGRGVRGLVTANALQRKPLRRGARAVVALQAPPGTQFKSLRWSGTVRRRDCGFALQLWADGPGVAAVPIRNVRANTSCPRRRRSQRAGWPRPESFDISGTSRIVQRVACVASRRQRSCSARGLNYIRTLAASVTVVDVTAPAVQITGGGLVGGAWVRGEQPVTFDASDNVGVAVERLMVASVGVAEQPRACDHARTVPCPNGGGEMRVDTSRLPDGPQSVEVVVGDTAANLASAGATALIDNTPPSRVDTVLEGGDGWRRTNEFALSWQNPAEPDRAPIVRAHYSICSAGTARCQQEARTASGIDRIGDLAVPGPGEHQLSVWREDAAGNADEDLASVPVTLRYDPDPPELGFEQSPAADPTLISVLVDDPVSGVARGEIELRRQGTATWQALETTFEGSRLLTRIDDASLEPGVYELRARAVDQAGNEASSDRRLDGTPMTVTLPLRADPALQAGVPRTRVVQQVVRRGGERRKVRRRVVELLPRVRVALGRGVRISGALTTADGRPIPGAALQLLSRSETRAEQPIATVTTDSEGRYTRVILATNSQTVRVGFAGTALIRPASDEVSLHVSAHTTLTPSKRRLVNGQTVTFLGRVRSLPVPAAGKLVELQVRLNGRWQTFRTTRTDPGGAWRVRYRFVATRQRVARYRFRARLPREAGYPFTAGMSRTITVKVRGRG